MVLRRTCSMGLASGSRPDSSRAFSKVRRLLSASPCISMNDRRGVVKLETCWRATNELKREHKVGDLARRAHHLLVLARRASLVSSELLHASCETAVCGCSSRIMMARG